LSIHRSKPLFVNCFSRLSVGGFQRLARVPVPATINSGSPAVPDSGGKCLKFRVKPSRAANSMVSKRSAGIGSIESGSLVDGVWPLVDRGAAIAI
jgi:hypothetical protein